MNGKPIFIGLAILAMIIIAVMYFKKDTPTVCPSVKEAIDEGYDIGFIDGVNAFDDGGDDDDDTNAKETFYDYEYDKGGKKYQKRTGSKFVNKEGGQCPPHTKEVKKSGKWNGKCQKQMSWYKTYRAQDNKGRLFTCTGGRVAQNGNCVCDAKQGKTWNGSKCVCDKSRGLKWDSKTKRCRNKHDGRTASTPVLKFNPKPCPRFQKWRGDRCQCDYDNGLWWDGKACICDTGKGWVWDGNKGKCVRK